MSKYFIAFLLFVLLSTGRAEAAQLTACTSGASSCTNDTTNNQGLVTAVSDPIVGARIYDLWIIQCNGVYAEAASTIGHQSRVNMCQAIAAGRIPNSTLVSLILSPAVQTQILQCQNASFSPAGGCMVDADVNLAIGAALTVTEAAATTTATQATVGAATLALASATGVVRGQSVFAAGVPPGTTVTYVNGTTIYLSSGITAALSATPIAFVMDTGLATRGW